MIVPGLFYLINFSFFDCDSSTSFEFLEYVEDELTVVLRRLAPGIRFWGTVPNFEFLSHDRHLSSYGEVLRSYDGLFVPLAVDSFDAPNGTQRYYPIRACRIGVGFK